MIDIALNMVVYNEAHRIEQTLDHAAQWASEMVIVDQESTDNTPEIINEWAQRNAMPLKLLRDRHWGYCEPSRVVAWQNTLDSNWIMVLDADEHISPEWYQEMQNFDTERVGARLKRSLWINGYHRFTGDYQFRFFNRYHVMFLSEIHTEPQPYHCYPEAIVSPEYVGIFHRKTWQEQLRDELSYEELIKNGNEPAEAKARKLALNVHLQISRDLGMSGPELDQLDLKQQQELGIAGMDFDG